MALIVLKRGEVCALSFATVLSASKLATPNIIKSCARCALVLGALPVGQNRILDRYRGRAGTSCGNGFFTPPPPPPPPVLYQSGVDIPLFYFFPFRGPSIYVCAYVCFDDEMQIARNTHSNTIGRTFACRSRGQRSSVDERLCVAG